MEQDTYYVGEELLATGEGTIIWGQGERIYRQHSDYFIVDITNEDKGEYVKLSPAEAHQLRVNGHKPAPHMRPFVDLLLQYKEAVVRARSSRNALAEDDGDEAKKRFQQRRRHEEKTMKKLLDLIEQGLAQENRQHLNEGDSMKKSPQA